MVVYWEWDYVHSFPIESLHVGKPLQVLAHAFRSFFACLFLNFKMHILVGSKFRCSRAGTGTWCFSLDGYNNAIVLVHSYQQFCRRFLEK